MGETIGCWLTRHPVGIALQRVAGHCEEATVISRRTGLVMTGRPMGFWEMATVHEPYSTHDMARASNTVLAAWTKLRLLEETGQSPSTVGFGRKMGGGPGGFASSDESTAAHKTMHTLHAHKIRPKYISRTTLGIQMSTAWGYFGSLITSRLEVTR